MADVQTATTASKSGKPMQKRLSTRIDLTPMVDLGFLLITFFIFTTTLMQPSIMKLNLPEDAEHNMLVAESKTLNLVLCKNNTVGYYFGADANSMKFTNYSSAGIRLELQKAQDKMEERFGDKSQLFAVIKPTPESSYKNIVDVLDEMLISDVKHYVLTEADEKERDKAGKK